MRVRDLKRMIKTAHFAGSCLRIGQRELGLRRAVCKCCRSHHPGQTNSTISTHVARSAFGVFSRREPPSTSVADKWLGSQAAQSCCVPASSAMSSHRHSGTFATCPP